jgi:nicotinamide-nucleotide amidase
VVALRELLSAELLSIGSELTVGETRDTNSGEIARSLTELGIEVRRIQALPDDLESVTDAFAAGLRRADIVVSTGGLGPTPDDLTREAIGAAVGETPQVDPELEAWLRGLWSRRGIPMPDMNLKQAWRIPSATALPNGAGTAPAWWVDRPDGRVVVALPGPPREMRPIWRDEVLPRLRARDAGTTMVRRTFRLAGIGESAVADRLGEPMLRASNPQVATYARADAVDVRISARGAGAAAVVGETADRVLALVGDHVWAEGDTTWSEAIGAELASRGWTLGCVEVGTGGTLTALFGDPDWLRFAESLAADSPAAIAHPDADADVAPVPGGALPSGAADGLEALARRAAEVGGADVGVGLRIRDRGGDTAVTVAIVSPLRAHRERHLAFLGGAAGKSRSALVAASAILTELRRS